MEEFLASFCIVRVCQRQLGFLVKFISCTLLYNFELLSSQGNVGMCVMCGGKYYVSLLGI